MRSKYFAFLLLLFLSIFTSFSQEKSRLILLTHLLLKIEKKFDVKFSFAPNSINGVRVKNSFIKDNLKEIILFLNNSTPLEFNVLNNRYITVSKKSKAVKTFEQLNPVIINRYLTTGLQKKQDESLVLNTQKFGLLPGLTNVDVLQAIQSVPGIESENESINYINVRGGTNDQNLVLWEGKKCTTQVIFLA